MRKLSETLTIIVAQLRIFLPLTQKAHLVGQSEFLDFSMTYRTVVCVYEQHGLLHRGTERVYLLHVLEN